MATNYGYHRKRKRNLIDPNKVLSLGEKVEVRSVEDGFQGSWHAGVITQCRPLGREVRYDNLLTDDQSDYLTEFVEVSSMIDGNVSKSKVFNGVGDRGRIRPVPSVMNLAPESLQYGLCVDAYYNDAWWEGVVFDSEEGRDGRKIFFPDLGDEMPFESVHLRLTQDWDEFTGEWKPRGRWLFLDIIEEFKRDNVIPVSIPQIWYDVRERADFGKIGEWSSPVKHLWRKLVLQVIGGLLNISVDEFLNSHCFSETETIDVAQDSDPSCEPSSLCPLAIIAPVNNGFEKVDSMMGVDELAGNVERIMGSQDASPSSRVAGWSNSAGFWSNSSMQSRDSDSEDCLGSAREKWKPAHTQFNLEPIYCPQAMDEYLLSGCHRRDVCSVRNHLLSIGWKIYCAKVHGIMRVRYTSPEGKNFSHLRLVCETVKNNPSGNARGRLSSPAKLNPLPMVNKQCLESEVAGESAVSEPSDEADDLEPEYCPDAIFSYLKRSKRKPRSNDGLAAQARKHLKAIGWYLWLKPKNGKGEWRYVAPNQGKTYYSLRTACQAIAAGREKNTHCLSTSSPSLMEDSVCNEGQSGVKKPRKLRSSQIVKHHKGKKNGYLGPSDGGSTNRVKNDSQKGTRVLRSSKRIRLAGPSANSQVPRTLFSWLIDNGVVLPRDKVQYRNKRSVRPMAEGRITREGIKCSCCLKVFTISNFEVHAGGRCRRPSESIYLEDGRSLAECVMQVKNKNSQGQPAEQPLDRKGGGEDQMWNDVVCSACHYGGELILCDSCPASFHATCLNLQGIPDGDWFCPSCCCGICGESRFDTNKAHFTDNTVLYCCQCERKFHARCIRDREMVKMNAFPKENWFCSKTCEKVNWGLQQLLGQYFFLGRDNLTWTLIKPTQSNPNGPDDCDALATAENYSKLSVALEVMHECFQSVTDPQTNRDLAEDVIFSRWSNLSRLNFRGFYTVLLERNDELITVAALRVYGNKVAEIPLIGTRFQHRRQGMCRILMNEIEMNLKRLGVERLVLPAAPSVLNTWTSSFGFSPMTVSERFKFLGYAFLDFQDTVMCQKVLKTKLPSPSLQLLENTPAQVIHYERREKTKANNAGSDPPEENSDISEVFQEDCLGGTEDAEQGAQSYLTAEECSVRMETKPTNGQESGLLLLEPKGTERDHWDGVLTYYRRKKAAELRPSSVPRAKYAKVEGDAILINQLIMLEFCNNRTPTSKKKGRR